MTDNLVEARLDAQREGGASVNTLSRLPVTLPRAALVDLRG